MSNTAYSMNLSSGVLRPIQAAGTLPRGSVLIYSDMANDPKDYVVLDEGFTCSHGQKAMSEFGGIAHPSKDAVETPGGWRYFMDGDKPKVLSEAEIEEFVAAAKVEGERLERERKKKVEAERIARDKATESHKRKYGKVLTSLSDSKRGSSATGAANAKKLLSKAFPSVKFSAKSDYNSIRVSWENGPRPNDEEVEEICSLLTTGAFNSMEDYHYSIDNPFADLFGGADYVFFSREITGDKFLETAKELGIEGVTVDEWNNLSGCSVEDRETIYRQTRAKSFVEVKEKDSPKAKKVLGVQVSENEEKDGVEIIFPAKPEEAVRNALKFNGFRWSRRSGLWYAKRNEARLSFAKSLIS